MRWHIFIGVWAITIIWTGDMAQQHWVSFQKGGSGDYPRIWLSLYSNDSNFARNSNMQFVSLLDWKN